MKSDAAEQVVEYLSMLADTIENDIRPLTQLPGHAPHAVAREIFSYIDHLGSLAGGRTSTGSTALLAKEYITKFLARIDPVYRDWGGVMYEMYRHGTVHNFAPQTLTNGTTLLLWFEYFKGRIFDLVFTDDGERIVIQHGKPFKRQREAHWRLPISMPCLVDDLKGSISLFAAEIETDSQLLQRVIAHKSFLNTPKRIAFNLP